MSREPSCRVAAMIGYGRRRVSRRDAIDRTSGKAASLRRGETFVRGTVFTLSFAAGFARTAKAAAWQGLAPVLVALVALSGLWTAGCYETPRPDCGFTCGKDGACPDGYVCGAANRCRLPSVPDSQCTSATPGMGADAMPADAAPTQDAPRDAGIDAMPDSPIDAMPDSMPDGMPDAGTDAGTDAAVDAPGADAAMNAAR